MAGVAAVGTGATLTTGELATFALNITSISFSGISRESIDTTHMGTGEARTFIPGDLYDPGQIEIEFQVPTDSPLTNFKLEDVLQDATTTFVLTLTEGGDWTGNGFVTDISFDVPLEELVTGSVTLKCSGGIDTTN